MDRSVLAARIQDILKGRTTSSRPEAAAQPRRSPEGEGGQDERGADLERGRGANLQVCDEEGAFAARCAADEAAANARDVLGGDVIDGPSGACLVVDRRYRASHVHGRYDVERFASAAAGSLHTLPWFLGGVEPRGCLEPDALPPRLLFFDLETTGLSGGAGTYAFLVGCAWFEDADLITRQFLLRGYGEERALLEAVRAFVEGRHQPPSPLPSPGDPLSAVRCRLPAVLVTYNGRAFDLPLIETRYLLHRRESPFAELPHVDMLFSARRLWKQRPSRQIRSAFDRLAGEPGDLRASCALTALEQDILGLHRCDDVPGWEIPARYFAYTRTGDARGLAAVLEHNRLDLVSLAAITATVLEMAARPDLAGRSRYDCLAIARLLDYLRREDEAERCYERAAEPDGLVEGEVDRAARAEALHWLALRRRRARRFADAADAWRRLLQVPGLDADLRREACEALAVHHEHRVKDLASARAFALGALDLARGGRYAPDVEHRLDRLARKMGRQPAGDTPLPMERARFPD